MNTTKSIVQKIIASIAWYPKIIIEKGTHGRLTVEWRGSGEAVNRLGLQRGNASE